MTGRYEVMVPDAKGQRPVDSSKVPERENRDQTRPVSAGHTVNTGVQGILTEVSGQHDRSVRSPYRGT